MPDAYRSNVNGCFCKDLEVESQRKCKAQCDYPLSHLTMMSDSSHNLAKSCGLMCREDAIEDRARFNSSIADLNSLNFYGIGIGGCKSGVTNSRLGGLSFSGAGAPI